MGEEIKVGERGHKDGASGDRERVGELKAGMRQGGVGSDKDEGKEGKRGGGRRGRMETGVWMGERIMCEC